MTSGRILVVDDNLVNRKVAVAMLTNLGYSCDVAADGVAAVEAFGQAEYDAVLMDLYMPNLGGFEATEQIREKEVGKRTPIVAVTASALEADREHCFAVGMDDCVVKPINMNDLGEVLERLIR